MLLGISCFHCEASAAKNAPCSGVALAFPAGVCRLQGQMLALLLLAASAAAAREAAHAAVGGDKTITKARSQPAHPAPPLFQWGPLEDIAKNAKLLPVLSVRNVLNVERVV